MFADLPTATLPDHTDPEGATFSPGPVDQPFSLTAYLRRALAERDELYVLALTTLRMCDEPKVVAALLRQCQQLLKDRDAVAEKLHAAEIASIPAGDPATEHAVPQSAAPGVATPPAVGLEPAATADGDPPVATPANGTDAKPLPLRQAIPESRFAARSVRGRGDLIPSAAVT
jgi:hypothetical protein